MCALLLKSKDINYLHLLKFSLIYCFPIKTVIFGRYASSCDATVAYLVDFWTELQMFGTLLDFPKVFMVQHELINHEFETDD